MPNLTLVSDYATDSSQLSTIKTWASGIAEASGGKHSITVYGAGELVSGWDSLDAVSSGVADMAFSSSSTLNSLLPELQVHNIALNADSSDYSNGVVFRRLARSGEFDETGMQLLAADYAEPFILIFSGSASTSPSDLEGFKIAKLGGEYTTELLEGLGITPVLLPSNELYTALTTGVVDGALVPASLAKELGLDEVTQTQFVFPDAQGLYTPLDVLVIAEDVMQGLPQDLQSLLTSETTYSLSQELGQAALNRYEDALKVFEGNDGLQEVNGSDLANWQRVIDQFNQGILRDLGVEDDETEEDLLGLEGDLGLASSGPFVLIVPRDLGVSSVSELDGATVAIIPGTEAESAVTELFDAAGLSYQLVALFSEQEALEAFLSGRADVLVVPVANADQDSLDADFMILQESFGQPEATSLSDLLTGTDLADDIAGLDGADTIRGKEGDDRLNGGAGDDKLFGNQGEDRLVGKAGSDRLLGQGGDDRLYGGAGQDTLLGGAGADKVTGSGGADQVMGNGGSDTLKGGGGRDEISGGGGRDLVVGNAGSDLLTGGRGDDVLKGGRGKDTFVFAKGHGSDTVRDFSAGLDIFEIGRGASGMKQLDFVQQGNDVLVSFKNVVITIEDAFVAVIQDRDNFIFT